METKVLTSRRQLPKLMACITKGSLENMRNRALFNLDVLDAKGIRRRKKPLYECLILELKENGYTEAADYLQDLIYDNIQLISEDDIGIVIDLRKREDYLEDICSVLQAAEKERDRDNKKKEAIYLLSLALCYTEKGKGILWLAEKFFLACIAVASQYLLDGGRQKNVCKYYYAKFLLDKFPDGDPEEAFVILTEVRDSSVGRSWPLEEDEKDDESERDYNETVPKEEMPVEMVFSASAVQLHRVLLGKVKKVRTESPAKAERLARLAERRAIEANETDKVAEAIIEIGISQLLMNNFNNALNTFERAEKIHQQSNNVMGLCETKMHTAAVLQKLGKHAEAAKLLTEMGALAMEHGLRRQLGRALHLLGELHLRRERPEHGTQHLKEAFACFTGYGFPEFCDANSNIDKGSMHQIFRLEENELFEEEAEQSRFMMAVSAGQELMASYFNLLREAGDCTVAQSKTIEWKLSKAGWWVKRYHHDFVPCLCRVHHRTPLDVLRIQKELQDTLDKMALEADETEAFLGRQDTIVDIATIKSQPFDEYFTNSHK